MLKRAKKISAAHQFFNPEGTLSHYPSLLEETAGVY